MADDKPELKPYLKVNGYDPQGVGYNYKDLVKVRPLTTNDIEEIVTTSGTTTIFGTPSPLTTKGDVYTYDTADQRLPVGANDKPLVADSAETTGLKWKTLPIAGGGTGQTTQTAAFDALAPTTTKGDLVVHNGTDNISLTVGADGKYLKADSTAASGLKWESLFSYPGFALFGDGADGDVTISGTTRLASTGRKCIKKYNNLTVNSGILLGGDANAISMCIYVKGTLTMASGAIITGTGGGTAAGGTGGTGLTGAGNGGVGGNGNCYVQVFAKTVEATGTGAIIGAFGGDGGNATSAGTPTVNFGGANGGLPSFGVNVTLVYGDQKNLTSASIGIATGTAPVGGQAETSEYINTYYDIESNLFLGVNSNNTVATRDLKCHYAHAAPGGGSGRVVMGGAVGLQGASGGGSHGFFTAGTTGPAGGAAGPTGGNIATGGGGGGGGCGSFTRVVFWSILGTASNLTVSSKGGNGGNGGNGATTNGGGWGGSTGGNGGPGGILYYVGPTGPTCTVAGGTGGTNGNNANGGSAAGATVTGPVGWSAIMTWAA